MQILQFGQRASVRFDLDIQTVNPGFDGLNSLFDLFHTLLVLREVRARLCAKRTQFRKQLPHESIIPNPPRTVLRLLLLLASCQEVLLPWYQLGVFRWHWLVVVHCAWLRYWQRPPG